MTTVDATPPEPAARRRRWRPSARLLIELALVVAAVAGHRLLTRQAEFPGPVARVLRRGTLAERTEAIRYLSRMGRAADPAIPALIRSLHRDPSPAIRRASAFLLGELARDRTPGGFDPLLRAASPAPSARATLFRRDRATPPPPHAEAERIAAGLVHALDHDADPTVRTEAIRSLADVLNGELQLAAGPNLRWTQEEIEAVPPLKALNPSPPWAVAAARAIARRAASPRPDESRLAAAWTAADAASLRLLDDDDRFAALLAASRTAMPNLMADRTDGFLVRLAAARSQESDARRAELLALLDSPRVMANVPEPTRIALFWLTAPGPDLVRRHPRALEVMIEWLGRPGPSDANIPHRFVRSPMSGSPQALALERAFAIAVGAGFGNEDVSGAHLLARTAEVEPANLDVVAERLGPSGWRNLASVGRGANLARRVLLNPARRSRLPAETAAAVAGALLGEPDGPVDGRLIGRYEALLVAAFFVRAAPAGHAVRGEYARRVFAFRADALGESTDWLEKVLQLKAAVP